ncbi:hypothetical protein Bbelb_425970 [Branchiostoma belcheri]|nr:hypothetical protein Bbelb_425970 [Branchiostoma belcheri]
MAVSIKDPERTFRVRKLRPWHPCRQEATPLCTADCGRAELASPPRRADTADTPPNDPYNHLSPAGDISQDIFRNSLTRAEAWKARKKLIKGNCAPLRAIDVTEKCERTQRSIWTIIHGDNAKFSGPEEANGTMTMDVIGSTGLFTVY